MSIIDADGYRANIGIILMNDRRRLFWGKRLGQNAWQFPQGGVQPDETDEQALFRELEEEVGLLPEHVEIMASTREWLKYELPQQYIRHHSEPLCIGQKQKWFLLKLVSSDDKVSLTAAGQPEFDDWRWVSYWYPMHHVIDFKQNVYKKALKEFVPTVFGEE